MDRQKEWIWVILSLLAFLTGPGFGYSIIEGPRNATVLVGSVARFSCTVSEGWKILIWLLNGQPKLSVLSSGVPIQTDLRYTQTGHTSSTEFTSELMIDDVQLSDSGQITCSLQNDASESAFLSVQVNGSLNIRDSNLAVRKNQTIEIVCEAFGWAPAPHMTWMVNNISVANSGYVNGQSQGSNGLYNEESILTLTPLTNDTVTCLAAIEVLSKPQYATVTLFVYDELPPIESGKYEDDWRTRTIILAVVLSVVGLLLLILIILLIICCCKRRKESNYQKELRKVSEKKIADRNLETMRHSGLENYGYSLEEPRHNEEMAGVPASSPVNPSFYGPEQDLEVNPTSEVPYDGQHDEELPPINPRNIRNVTIV
ncbi:immunoglobulin superfamily member 5 [Tiliqua scincoides]|uniref:immunoglobulin superfamily member 5 n=1 Tax=Tiliqua scincoides TaxID=71010 RepID=UPI00346217DF